jgi:hypothetical protein
MLNVWVAVELLVMPLLTDRVCAALKLLMLYALALVKNVMLCAALVEVSMTVLLLAPTLPNVISSVVVLELVDEGCTPFVQLVPDVQLDPVLFHRNTTAWALLAAVVMKAAAMKLNAFFIMFVVFINLFFKSLQRSF